VRLNQLVDDRETETAVAAVTPRKIRLVEAVEDVWQSLSRDRRAIVVHLDPDLAGELEGPQLNLAAAR